MRIVLATPLYPPEIGGPATDTAALQERFEQSGIETVVCAFRDVRQHPKIIRHFMYGRAVYRAAKGASCIIAMDVSSVGAPAALAACLRGVPFIVRVPGDYAWEQGVQRFGVKDTIDDFQRARYGFRVETLRLLERFVVGRAVVIATISDYFTNLIQHWGVRQDRVMRVYPGLDPDEVREAPGRVPSGKIIFTYGRLVPWKGIMTLVELLPELATDWKLVIAGDGPERPRLESRTRALGLEERITFTGVLPRRQILGWLTRADVFVLNTAQENFSFQVLEALGAGAAIVTTRVGSLPELVTDGVEGVLVTPNDRAAIRAAIESVEREPDVWHARREAARMKARAFTAQASADALAAAILKVCV